MLTRFIAFLAAIALASAAVAQQQFSETFETAKDNAPAGWTPSTWAGAPKFGVGSPGARAAGSCATVASETGADAAWTRTVPVRPSSVYRLSGAIRTENVTRNGGRGALFNIHGVDGAATPAVTGTSDWTRVEVLFETGDMDAVQVNCLLGGWGLASGTAYFDDVELTFVRAVEVVPPSVVIDGAAATTPISPLIYGQFIEHLGRCIQGGIWAEMLEDRKFFNEPGTGDSPWRSVNAASLAKDVRQPDLVAGAARVLSSGAPEHGIEQRGLALTRNAMYVASIWLAAEPNVEAVTVSLVWGDAPAERTSFEIADVPDDLGKFEFHLRAGATIDDGRFEVRAKGAGTFWAGAPSLMPDNNVGGLRADVLALLRELDAPVYRWPGGNFVSGYDWKDGIGDRDRRPPRKNPAWKGIESNDFGLHEFLDFCAVLGTEPYIAVNAGLGEVDSARDQVEYVRGGSETPMGALRASNGRESPWPVRWWGIGNEMYGDWQLGHMPVEKYAAKHNAFAAAMRGVDPSIMIVGVGAIGGWDEVILASCASSMDHISEHIYAQERPTLSAHVRQIPDMIRVRAETHRKYRDSIPSLKGRDIRIIMDEWNYWYGPEPFGELGTRYFLKDALGIGAGIHEFVRNADLYLMANYAQTVNVLGCIKADKRRAAIETTGLVLLMYRRHFGVDAIPAKATGVIDAAAAWTRERDAITVGFVNPTRSSVTVPVTFSGVAAPGAIDAWSIGGDDPEAYNTPSRPRVVSMERSTDVPFAGSVTLGPCSVTIARFAIAPVSR